MPNNTVIKLRNQKSAEALVKEQQDTIAFFPAKKDGKLYFTCGMWLGAVCAKLNKTLKDIHDKCADDEKAAACELEVIMANVWFAECAVVPEGTEPNEEDFIPCLMLRRKTQHHEEKLATVHPYKGYLNTEFRLYAKGLDKVEYNIFLSSNESPVLRGSFYPNIPHTIKLNIPGHYRVDFNDGTSSEIIVEDGYKFGGGEYKTSFVFDETPWCFVIMKDRTYFYNRDTEEEYVEAISPDNLSLISANYILLKNNNYDEQTIYSLNEQRPILCISNVLYFNENTILWIENGEEAGECFVSIYSFAVRKIVKKIKTILR